MKKKRFFGTTRSVVRSMLAYHGALRRHRSSPWVVEERTQEVALGRVRLSPVHIVSAVCDWLCKRCSSSVTSSSVTLLYMWNQFLKGLSLFEDLSIFVLLGLLKGGPT